MPKSCRRSSNSIPMRNMPLIACCLPRKTHQRPRTLTLPPFLSFTAQSLGYAQGPQDSSQRQGMLRRHFLRFADLRFCSVLLQHGYCIRQQALDYVSRQEVVELLDYIVGAMMYSCWTTCHSQVSTVSVRGRSKTEAPRSFSHLLFCPALHYVRPGLFSRSVSIPFDRRSCPSVTMFNQSSIFLCVWFNGIQAQYSTIATNSPEVNGCPRPGHQRAVPSHVCQHVLPAHVLSRSPPAPPTLQREIRTRGLHVTSADVL